MEKRNNLNVIFRVKNLLKRIIVEICSVLGLFCAGMMNH